MRRAYVTILAGTAAALMMSPASASLVFDDSIQLSAQGFGNAPKELTLQGTGTISGCVGTAAGGGATFGVNCTTDAQTFAGNEVTNANGTTFMPNPLADNQKYGNPTVAELGWTSAADIAILFNGAQPGGGGINVTDITLSFFNALTGGFLGAIDGQQNFADSNPGAGSAGFVFTVDAAQQIFLNALIFDGTDLNNIRIGLGATLEGSAGGPSSFMAVNLSQAGAVPEPGTWAMMLIGFGAIGVGMRRRRRTGQTLLQVA